MDNWLYGISRVREKMQYWEQLLLLSEAAGKTELTMDPVQLPHRNDDSWLALEVPPEYQGDSDKLLYTAHYAVPFDKTKRQCGLLLDDWTELIPAKKETTGIAFHYDRPSSEPAQVMLLALPASSTGAWKWDDLVDAVKDSVLSAKLRAIEPAMINETAYGRLLPALYSSSTALPITAGLNLSFNNSVHEKLNL